VVLFLQLCKAPKENQACNSKIDIVGDEIGCGRGGRVALSITECCLGDGRLRLDLGGSSCCLVVSKEFFVSFNCGHQLIRGNFGILPFGLNRNCVRAFPVG
jgi:hypothetical protein